MTIPASGPVSMNSINVELSIPSGTRISLNQTNARNLLGKPTNQSLISLADARGKSSVLPTLLLGVTPQVTPNTSYVYDPTTYTQTAKGNAGIIGAVSGGSYFNGIASNGVSTVIFAVSNGAKFDMYYTNDKGTSWGKTNVIASGNKSTVNPVIYGNGRFFGTLTDYSSTAGAKVISSTDGISWASYTGPYKNMLYTYTPWGLLAWQQALTASNPTQATSYSTNNGQTWTASTTLSADSTYCGFEYGAGGLYSAVLVGRKLLGSSYVPIIGSTSNGTNWSIIAAFPYPSGLTNATHGPVTYVGTKNGKDCYAIASKDAYYAYVTVSQDNGVTWTAIWLSSVSSYGQEATYIMSDFNGVVWMNVTGKKTIYKSSDYGSTWAGTTNTYTTYGPYVRIAP